MCKFNFLINKKNSFHAKITFSKIFKTKTFSKTDFDGLGAPKPSK